MHTHTLHTLIRVNSSEFLKAKQMLLEYNSEARRARRRKHPPNFFLSAHEKPRLRDLCMKTKSANVRACANTRPFEWWANVQAVQSHMTYNVWACYQCVTMGKLAPGATAFFRLWHFAWTHECRSNIFTFKHFPCGKPYHNIIWQILSV